VSIRRRCEHRRPGIRARSRPSLPAEDVTTHRGIPVTTPARSILDLATELGRTSLERLINNADKLDLIDPETLRTWLDDHAGAPGVRILRGLLDRRTFRLSDSDLEITFRPLAEAAGLPTPLTKQIVNDVEVDFFWPELGLVVESDGLRYHRTPASQSKDRRRDQSHTASGLRQLRFTHEQIKYEPEYVRDVLRRTAELLQGDTS
jgi:very-short-patch-repair endonuclease